MANTTLDEAEALDKRLQHRLQRTPRITTTTQLPVGSFEKYFILITEQMEKSLTILRFAQLGGKAHVLSHGTLRLQPPARHQSGRLNVRPYSHALKSRSVKSGHSWDTLARESKARPHLAGAVPSAGLSRTGEQGSSPL